MLCMVIVIIFPLLKRLVPAATAPLYLSGGRLNFLAAIPAATQGQVLQVLKRTSVLEGHSPSLRRRSGNHRAAQLGDP